MYHVKQLRRRSGNSTYCELPAIRGAQADRRQGPDRDRVGERAGLIPVRFGIQDGCPRGCRRWRLMAAGTILLLALVHDGEPRRAHAGTMTMMMVSGGGVQLFDVLDVQSARILVAVVTAGARSRLGLISRHKSRLR